MTFKQKLVNFVNSSYHWLIALLIPFFLAGAGYGLGWIVGVLGPFVLGLAAAIGGFIFGIFGTAIYLSTPSDGKIIWPWL